MKIIQCDTCMNTDKSIVARWITVKKDFEGNAFEYPEVFEYHFCSMKCLAEWVEAGEPNTDEEISPKALAT